MNGIEKALEWADMMARKLENNELESALDREHAKMFSEIADAYRAECNDFLDALDVKDGKGPTALSIIVADRDKHKKRADDLEAENARLKEAVNDAHRFLSEFKVVGDEDSMGAAFFTTRTSEDWYYILLNKLSALSQKPPISRDKPGEISMDEVDYGIFKGDSNV